MRIYPLPSCLSVSPRRRTGESSRPEGQLIRTLLDVITKESKMRKVVAHLIMTLDGVVKFDAVIDTIMKHRNAEEVLPDFFAKVAEEDAILLGRVTYQE